MAARGPLRMGPRCVHIISATRVIRFVTLSQSKCPHVIYSICVSVSYSYKNAS